MPDNKFEQIQTFIFMDFEVAGKLLETEFAGDLQPRNAAKLDNTEYLKRLLASVVDLNRVPRITEMSYIFIPRALFIEAAENMHQKLLKNESEERDGPIRMELTMDICTNQINPDLNEDDWALYESKQASIRLRRSELAEKNRFEEVWPAIHHLLKVKPKPACLIAHNGLQFDFRILMHELERTNMLKEYPIPEGVYFLDSYLTFLDIEAANHRTIQQTLNAIDWNLLPIPQQNNSTSPKAEDEREEEQIMKEEEKMNKPDKNGEEEKDVNVMDEDDDDDNDGIIWVGADCPLAQHCPPSPTCSNSSSIVVTDKEEECQEKKVKENGGKVQQKIGKNEAKNGEEDEEILCIGQKRGIVNRGKIPMKGIGGCANVRKRRRLSPEELDPRHPFRFLRRSEWCPAKRRRIPADLFELDKESGQWHFSEHASNRLLSNSGNFKLPIIFRSIIGGDFRAHRAQADSEALLQVSLAYGMDFIELADKNCAKFPLE